MLRTCASCVARIPQTAPRGGNCKPRYCGRDCQKRHWKGGHKQICGQIKRGGGAEQYHADKKYKEAVVVAVKDCALDTKGQTCYICMEGAVRRHTANEGLVRMCACRGTSGCAHVSCLVRQAQTSVAEAEENNRRTGWDRWSSCGLCEQRYHSAVWCAMGWACWKTYLGRPETDQVRSSAMNLLSNGLQQAQKYEDALEVIKADLSIQERNGGPRHVHLATLGMMALVLDELRRPDEAIRIYEDIYAQKLSLYESSDIEVIITAYNLSRALGHSGRYREQKRLMESTIPKARKSLGDDHELTLSCRQNYAAALLYAENMSPASQCDLREATKILEDVQKRCRQVLGAKHRVTLAVQGDLNYARQWHENLLKEMARMNLGV